MPELTNDLKNAKMSIASDLRQSLDKPLHALTDEELLVKVRRMLVKSGHPEAATAPAEQIVQMCRDIVKQEDGVRHVLER